MTALVRWVLGERFQSLWRPGSHYQSLCRFYRFVDPKLEAQYVHHSGFMWRAILRIYCVINFLFAIQEFSNHVGAPHSPLFWVLFCIFVASLLLLLLSYCFNSVQTHVLPMHAVYACALGGMITYQLMAASMNTNDSIMGYIRGSGQFEMDPAAYARMQEKIEQLVGCVEVRAALLYGCAHWVSLSLAGFNGWTMLAYAAIFLASVVGVHENPFMAHDRAVNVFFFFVCTVGFVLVSVVMERVRRSDFLAQTQLSQELQASQLADNVLNHMLKNALADVAADIEVFLAGELGPEVLEDAVVCLRRGIRSCRERMVYLKMVAGEYVPVLNAIDLWEFGQQLVAGRNVALQALDSTVLMDGALMQLILENALSNAVKHGHPDHPDVQLFIQQGPPAQDSVVSILGQRQTVSFVVRNVAHPQRPQLTDDVVHSLFHGEARQQPSTVLPLLSDGIGLTHCGLAAKLGGITLSLRQEGDVVTFTATVEADVPEGAASSSTEDDFLSLASHFPSGLKIFCLDDSAASRRLVEFHLKKWCPSAIVRTYGAAVDDVNVFVGEALQEADIVILDQNLHFSRTSETYYGTDLCRQLIGFGFRGLVCIRSSDDSREDQTKYAASGAHCSFGKDVLGAKMVQQMKAAYVLNVTRPSLVDRRDSPFCRSPSSPCHPPALVWGL